jgi:hypothetical protein
LFLLFLQRSMDERNRNRSLAHGRRHPFEIASPHVTDREHAGQTGFEEMRSSSERPMRGGQIILQQIRSRLDEALGIEPGRN